MGFPYLNWFPSDFAGDVRVQMMSEQEEGAYRKLLDASWQLGPLPDPEATLRRLGFDGSSWAGVKVCWEKTPEGWINRRLEEEREKARKRHEDAKRAAEARERKRREGAEG